MSLRVKAFSIARRNTNCLLSCCKCKNNQLILLREYFERYCTVLPVSGFNSTKYEINMIESYILPIIVKEQDIKLTVNKKANEFVSFNIRDNHLLDVTAFLGGATSLDSSLIGYKI